MADALSTAVSALTAFQNALSVTSNNIANANTPGYSVETPQFTPQVGVAVNGIDIGAGVDVSSVSRAFDQFTANNLWQAGAGLGQQTAFVNIANQVDNTIGSTSNGVSTALTNFFNSWQTLASNPTSATSEQAVLQNASSLASSITQTASQLNALSSNVSNQVAATVLSINGIGKQIASLNQQIENSTAEGSGAASNNLLDQRDQLLTQLSSLTSFTTSTESNGALDVFVGSGQALVVGNNASALGTQPSAYDPTETDITTQSGSSTQIITTALTGGQLGGLLQVQSQLISPALSQLGQIATGLAVAVNSQQAAGTDQNGNPGQPIFSISAPTASAAATNAGSASLTGVAFPATPAGVTAVGQLTGSNYTLLYTSTGWTATVAGTGTSATVTTGTNAGGQTTLTVGGATYTLTGTPSVGDSFLAEPTAAAASSLAVSLSNPLGLASAGPVQSAPAATNAGTGLVSSPTVAAASDPTLRYPATITFSNANTYTITTTTPSGPVTSAAQTLGADGVITAPAIAGITGSGGGWTVTVTGTPQPADSFTVGPTAARSGDNSNANAIAGLLKTGVFNGGTISLSTGYANLVGSVASTTQQATTSQSAQQSLVTSAQQAMSSTSGVNLNEEAANMLQWQNAYQAAAKVVTTVESLFTTLISAIQAG